MSKGVIALRFLGRFGNCMHSYATARSYAERHDLELQTDAWIGQRVFGLTDPPIADNNLMQRCENTLADGEKDFIFRSYCQQQKCITYTRKDCLRWFKFSEEIVSLMNGFLPPYCMAHRRTGDYKGYGYPIVSRESYYNAAVYFQIESPWIATPDEPFDGHVPGDLKDIADFYHMTKTAILYRGNSTYSWWAAVLNPSALVLSPIMSKAIGGQENTCPFTIGNWPKFRSDLPFLTDLHLPE